MIAEPQGVCEKAADIQHLCALGGVSRAGYYRDLAPKAARRDDADLRDLIQRVALDNRAYGYRRIAHELRRQGLLVNMKRVLRLTREDNLLALRRRPFVPQTTMSRHGFEIAPNRMRSLKPTGLDQIWVADITYVRLAEDFVYLAVVLDAFSRKVVGWALADHLEASLAIEALDMALSVRDPAPDSLIHHSDRAVQYASLAYLARLRERKIAVSMSRPANPYDNAKAESFMKTLKHEEVNATTCADVDDARRQIGAFIETVYNEKRLHSALGYKPPTELEAEPRRDTDDQTNQNKALSPISGSQPRGAVHWCPRPKRRQKWCWGDQVEAARTHGDGRFATSVSFPRAGGEWVSLRNHPNSRSLKFASSPETAVWLRRCRSTT
jgi:putative transposase